MGGPRFAAGTARLRPVLTPPVGGLSGEARSSSRLVALSYVRVQFSCRNCECRVRSNGVPMLQVSFVWGWNMGADDGWIVLSWPGSTSDDSPVMPLGCYFSTSTVLLAFTVGYTRTGWSHWKFVRPVALHTPMAAPSAPPAKAATNSPLRLKMPSLMPESCSFPVKLPHFQYQR